ncbi:MAG: hypothetical protein ONB11_10460 [candidate division KSB1 bacterium]|nr:hypothetical protein [candidate division KSB1 bacterium]MDZ7342623.1 hypothetical protein [candidate division KSB1 bacterium]
MTPFHPKLRRALLEDKTHVEQGLTPELLDSYEALLVQYFYAANYSTKKHRSELDTLLKSIADFQRRYLPNLAAIQTKWVKQQKRIVLSNLGGLELHRQIVKRLWFVGHFIMAFIAGLFRKNQQPDQVGTTHQNE